MRKMLWVGEWRPQAERRRSRHSVVFARGRRTRGRWPRSLTIVGPRQIVFGPERGKHHASGRTCRAPWHRAARRMRLVSRTRVLPALLCTAAVTVYYGVRLLGLFPLCEYRDWISRPVDVERLRVGFEHVLACGLDSRDVSLIYTQWTGMVAGLNYYGLNALNLLPVPATCFSLYWLCRQLGIGAGASAAAILLWGFSFPVMDALRWQATIHDRLALLFCCLGINLALGALNRPRRLGAYLLGNLGVLGCLVLAYNSKESSFYLAPSLVVLAAACPHDSAVYEPGRSRLLTNLRRNLGYLVAPLAYGVWHAVHYLPALWAKSKAEWASHIIGGSFGDNAIPAIAYVLGSDTAAGPEAGWLLVAILAIVGLACALRKALRPPPQGFAFGLLGWLAISYALATTVTLQTRYPAAYYQYTPRLLLVLFVVYGVHGALGISRGRCEGEGKPHTAFNPFSGTVVVAALSVSSAYALFTSKAYEDTNFYLRAADNFAASLPAIRRHVSPDDHIQIATAAPLNGLTDIYSGDEGGLLRFMFGRPDLTRPVAVEALYNIDLATWQPPVPTTTYLVYDQDLRLYAIDRGGRRFVGRDLDPRASPDNSAVPR